MLYSDISKASLTEIVVSSINDEFFAEAQFALTLLKPTDNIETVSNALLNCRSPQLWRIFLENESIQQALTPYLGAMYYHAKVISDAVVFDPLWDEIVDDLNQRKIRVYNHCRSLLDVYFKAKEWKDIQTRTEILSALEDTTQIDNIVEDLITSEDPELWFALINNPSLNDALAQQHYARLVSTLLYRAKTGNDARWIVLLTRYLLEGYPRTYHEVLFHTPECFETILEYASSRIENYCRSDQLEHIHEKVKWLKLLLVLSSQEPMRILLQQHNPFNLIFGACIAHLEPDQIFQMYQLFPHQLPSVLDHAFRNIKHFETTNSYTAYRAARNLLKRLFEVKELRAAIQAESAFYKVLGVPCVSQLIEITPIPALIIPAYSASVAAATTSLNQAQQATMTDAAPAPSPRPRLQRQQSFRR